MKIDINADLGESFGKYRLGNDEELMKYISSCNIACGFHAGDPSVIKKTVLLALENSVQIGAHPGYPDLMGFGRRNMDIENDELFDIILYQVGALKSITEAYGGVIRHVKPHGALYNTAAINRKVAETICKAVKKIDDKIGIMGLSGSYLTEEATASGLIAVNEVFADRQYENDGTLVSRKKPNSSIEDSQLCLKRVIKMIKEGKVESIENKIININAESICIHGDGKKAIEFAKIINEGLFLNDIEIRSFI